MRFLIIILTGLSILDSNGQSDNKINDFYKMQFGSTSKGKIYCFATADSLNDNALMTGYGNAMWAFNDYLFANYSKTTKAHRYLKSLLPDTAKVNFAFDSLLALEQDFDDIFFKAYNKNMVNDITIDSLAYIASRYFLVHRSRGKVVQHLCATINDAKKIEQNENSPYYNAFCYMAISSNDKVWNLFNSAVKPYKDELWGSDNISDDRLEEIKLDIFGTLSTNEELKNILIEEYNRKKDYLNFIMVL